MEARQVEAIAMAIAGIYGKNNEAGRLCCTLEAINADGVDVSIQVLADSINLAPYPYADEPLTRLQLSGALEELEDIELELVDWDANAFATVGTSGNAPNDVARLVHETFTKVMGCAPDYTFKASTENLG